MKRMLGWICSVLSSPWDTQMDKSEQIEISVKSYSITIFVWFPLENRNTNAHPGITHPGICRLAFWRQGSCWAGNKCCNVTTNKGNECHNLNFSSLLKKKSGVIGTKFKTQTNQKKLKNVYVRIRQTFTSDTLKMASWDWLLKFRFAGVGSILWTVSIWVCTF